MNMASAQETGTPDASVDSQHPWLGLASFTEETRQYFYGRDEEVGELSRRVQRKLLTILFGQSGLGKTSILSAGIVPRLRPEGFCPVYVRIDYSAEAIPPGEQIKQAIFRATEAQGSWTQSGVAVQGESLWEFLHHRDDELVDAAGKPIIPLLIFDQFEEIFTLAQADDGGRKRAAGFLEELADLVENRPPKALEEKIDADDRIAEGFDFARADYRILIALREDYLAHLEGVKGIMPSITQNRMRLARMTGQQALAAVMKPGGKLVTQEIAEAIVRFVAGGSELPNAEVEPSLLSLICRELNNARIAQGRSEISADLLAGSHDTILSEFYERALADQPPAVRKIIEDQLLTDSGYRENLAEERLKKAFAAAGAAPDALATLVNRRLLRIEERLDVRRVELTHDVLCGVVKASRELRLEREALEEAEKRLAEQKAREAATRKALIRARQIAVGCAALSVVAIGSAIYGYLGAERAKAAEAEAVKTRLVSEASRGEAEKLLEFLLDDFLKEMEPVGRTDVVASLARRTVEYYEKLPPEARSTVTQRNSAEAKTIYAGALNSTGKREEARKWADEAGVTLKALRDAGDQSHETLIAEARRLQVVSYMFSNRGDQPGTITVSNEALALLKPVLSGTTPPVKARELESRIYRLLGFAYSRTEQNIKAVEALQKSRNISRDLGALDLTNQAATGQYLAAGWVLGESLRDLRKFQEAKSSLEQDLRLADQLLSARPGHRTAVAAKSAALGALAETEGRLLNIASQLPYAREALKLEQELMAREAGSGVSRNNLRVEHWRMQDILIKLGRFGEAEPHSQQMLAVGKNERVDGFAAANFVGWHTSQALHRADLGDFNRARAEMAHAERYFAVTRAAGASERARLNAQNQLALFNGLIAIAADGDLSTVRRSMETEIAARKALFKGDRTAMSDNSVYAWMHVVGAETALIQGQYPVAEQFAREALADLKPDVESDLVQQSETNELRSRLAIALARQGKRDEANAVLVPVRAYYRLPQVFNSDDHRLKASHARALLADALANPSERATLLAAALARIEAMPATLKRVKFTERLRDEIAREMGK